MQYIGDKVKARILGQVELLLDENITKIDIAYGRFDKALTVSFSAKLAENEKNPAYVDVETQISFKLDEVKAKVTEMVSETQLTLPGMDKKAARG